MDEIITIIILVFLLVACFKWWSYKRMCEGLVFFAMMDHDWKINDDELKKILIYSIKRNIKDYQDQNPS